MRQSIIFILYLLCTFTARSQSALTPEQTGSIYYAYPVPSSTYTPAPTGYEPFYISHYGRHGSRWMTADERYTEVICVFDAQYMPGVRQTYEEFNVTVVFTEEEETADDYIERLAAELNTPKNQVSVATSDLNEQWTVFAQGALRVSARELEKRVAVTKSDLNKLSGQINLQRPPLRPMDSQSLRDLQKMMEK